MNQSSQIVKRSTSALVLIVLLGFAVRCQQQVPLAQAEEEMKALVERSLEIWNEGNLALVDELYAPGCVRHEVGIYADRVGLDSLKAWVTFFRTAYPDFNVASEELMVTDDKTIMRWTVTGTNTGPRGDLPPTDSTMRVPGVSIARIVDGKVVEEWVYYNQAVAMTQLGYTITPPARDEMN